MKSDGFGKAPAVLGMGEGISERKATDKLMSKGEECYCDLFHSKDLLVIVFDVENMLIEDVNEAAQDLYGYSKAEFLKLMPLDLSAGQGEAGFAMSGMKSGQAVDEHNRHRKQIKKDGTIFDAEM